jgi:5-methylcytosine-specific restriction endonuclease McrA
VPVALLRKPIPKSIQVQVFRRDAWLCRWCLRPVIFPCVMKYLGRLVAAAGNVEPPAYYNLNWRRDRAPLLDELGASVDHVMAHAKGGSSDIENLATICAKCNARKSDLSVEDHLRRYPLRKVKGKYGEPTNWDGLSSVFLALIDGEATLTDKQWAQALRR